MRKSAIAFGMAWCVAMTGLSGCGAKQEAPSAKHEEAKEHGDPHSEEGVVRVSVAQQQANRFEFAEALTRRISRTIQTTGSVAADETRIARIRPLARGRILTIRVRVGDAVRKGQEVASFDNIELGESIGQFRRLTATIERARTEVEVARKSLERAKNLVELGGIARGELEKREADAKNAEAAVREELAGQSILREKLIRFGLTESEVEGMAISGSGQARGASPVTAIRATQDGIVLKVSATEGEAVQPESQLFEIVDTSVVWVQGDLYDKDLSAVRVGDVATVSFDSYPGEKFQGRVSYIGDTVDPDSRTPKIRCEVANPGRRLKLDMYATIQLPSRGEKEALMAPNGALQRLEGKTVVFVRKEPEEFEVRQVVVGQEIQGWIEILQGLKSGETVVARGSFVLRAEREKAEMGEHGH